MIRLSLFRKGPEVVHFPHDPVPYQDPLMAALQSAGISSGYLPDPAGCLPLPSPLTALARIALFPLSLILARLRGARILHLHWTYSFVPGPRTPRFVRPFFRFWFQLQLRLVQVLGLRLVYTAHNLLPHLPIFDDDEAARRSLTRSAQAIIFHHAETATSFANRFGPPIRSRIIAQGVPVMGALPDRTGARTALGIAPEELLIVFLGRIAPYKGLPVLLKALPLLSESERSGLVVLVAGESISAPLSAELRGLAAQAGVPVRLRTERISDLDFRTALAAADLACLPFRSISNSGSVLSILAAGVPAIIPDHPSLSDLPASAVLRYDRTDPVSGCAAALSAAIALGPGGRAIMRRSALDWAGERTWVGAGRATAALYRDLLAGLTR